MKQNAQTRRGFESVRGFVFDLDGTLVLGDNRNHGFQIIPGAAEVLASLRRSGIPYVALTNGSLHTPQQYASTMRAIGVDLRDREMMTPASIAAEFLVRRGIRKVLVLGCEGVFRPLADAGLDVVLPPSEQKVDAVFVGWFPGFTFPDLEAACRAVWDGASLYVSSNARFFAARNGRALGVSAAIVTMITGITGRRAIVLGKPSPHALRSAGRRLGVPLDAIAVVGDDPVLEIAMARRGGAYAVAVQTGLADESAFALLERPRQPDLVLQTVGDLLANPEFRRMAG